MKGLEAELNVNESVIDSNEVNVAIPQNSPKNEKSQNMARGQWDGSLDFFISCLGYAVGLGNVWRFPFLCHLYGGGTFLVPYFIMLLAAGLPVFYLEIVIGQYAGVGPIKIFGRLMPVLRGLGHAVVSVGIILAFFYIVVVSWAIFYLSASISTTLAWSTCDHEYNTPECYVMSFQHNGRPNESKIIAGHHAVEEYWEHHVLGSPMQHSWNNMGWPRWQSVLCLLAAWVLVAVCLIRGIKSSGRVVYFTSLFPYLVLLILAIKGFTLDGALDGIVYYLTPSWNKLLYVDIWVDAATQVIFSLGPACGCVITLSSYNDFKRNCHKDAIVVAFLNSVTSIFSGLVVFSILGFMAKETNVPIENVAKDGPGLAFIVYPEIVTRMTGSQIWAFLFFLMLITLSLGSIFGAFETVITALCDQWPNLRAHKSKLVVFTAFSMFSLGLVFTTGGGMHAFTLFNKCGPSWNLLLFALLEVLIIGWVYKADNLLDNNIEMGIELSWSAKLYWNLTWRFITPSVLCVLLVMSWTTFGHISYNDYVFPLSIQILGYGITGCTIGWIPLMGILEIWKRKHNSDESCKSQLINPTSSWGRQKPALVYKSSICHNESHHQNEAA